MSRDSTIISNWHDGVLRDAAWVAAQPPGTRVNMVGPKFGDSAGTIDVVAGAGRNGGYALRMTTNSFAEGVPGFALYPRMTQSVALGGFMLPRDKRANRMECWMRFPADLGAHDTLSTSTEIPDNFHFGTFHIRPAGIGGSLDQESLTQEMGPYDGIIHTADPHTASGWHFYHEPIIEHTVLDDDWVRVVCNEVPGHLRTENGTGIPAKQPLHPHGDYWDCLTWIYFQMNPNSRPGNSDWEAGIGYPWSVYCDSVRMYWEDESDLPVVISFGDGWLDAQEVEIAPYPTTTNLPFTITNITGSTVTGRIMDRSASDEITDIINPDTGTSVAGTTTISLNAGETKTYHLRIVPFNGSQSWWVMRLGVVFTPTSEIVDANFRSKNDNRVRMHPYYSGYTGPDYTVAHRNVTAIPNGGSNSTYRPTSIGGKRYYTAPNTPFSFQIPGHDPGGGALTYAKIQSQSGRGTLNIASNGIASYTPPSAEFTGTCHFTYQINGGTAKPSEFYGAWVVVSPSRRVPMGGGGKVYRGPGGGIILRP